MPRAAQNCAPAAARSVADLILQRLRKHATRSEPAQVDAHSGRPLSWGELLEQAVWTAQGLRALGLAPGDVVALFSRNHHEVFPAVLGAILAGCTVCCCVPISNVAELRHCLSVCLPRLVFSEPSRLDTARQAAPDARHVSLFGPPAEGAMDFPELLRLGAQAGPGPQDFQPADVPDRRAHVVLVLFSSGTTGLPKGVELSDYCLSMRIANPLMLMCEEGDRYLVTSSLSWLSGATILFYCTDKGATRIFMTEPDPHSRLDSIQKYKATRWFDPPPVLMSMAALVDGRDLSSVRLVATGGTPMPAVAHADCTRALGIPVHVGYASTEAGIVFNSELGSKPKMGSIGSLAPGVTVKLVNPDTNVEVTEPNQVGEVRVKSPCVMKGYCNNPEATAEAFDEEGFYRSGDMVYMDADGFFYFVDRIKEMLKYKGLQIAPAEVEAVLVAHPGVLDACVVGRPTEDGDLVTAAVVRAPGPAGSAVSASELDALVGARLSDYKRPRGGVVFMEKLPRTATGKPARKELRSMLQDLLAPGPAPDT